MTNSSQKKLLVIGGGISGLSAAYYAIQDARAGKLPVEVTLLEKESRLGGVIETVQREGFTLERGPDSFITEKPWALALAKELGLEDKVIGTNSRYRGSMVLSRSRLVRVPEGFYMLAPAKPVTFLKSNMLSLGGKIRTLCEVLVPPRRETGDETVGSFIKRRFGKELYERVAQPMIGGIYSADPDHLSLEASLPRFQEMERQHGSIIRALCSKKKKGQTEKMASGPRYGLFASLRGGLEVLVDAMERSIPELVRRKGFAAGLSRNGAGFKVRLHDGSQFETDAVILALPAWSASDLLVKDFPVLAEELAGIPYENVATVSMAFSPARLSSSYEAFGYVVPAIEERPILGCTFSSLKYEGRAPENTLLLRAFVGGASHREILESDEKTLISKVVRDVTSTLKLQNEPAFSLLTKYNRALPTYKLNHRSKVERIFALAGQHGGLCLAGNGYGGVGIPDCVRSGKNASAQSLAFLFPSSERSRMSPPGRQSMAV